MSNAYFNIRIGKRHLILTKEWKFSFRVKPYLSKFHDSKFHDRKYVAIHTLFGYDF